MKKRVLWVGEASPLKTGFSTYYDNVLRLIYNTGKFEIAEYGSYMPTNDTRAASLPWKFYGAMPDIVEGPNGKPIPHPEQDRLYQKNYRLNQFGLWKFDEVVADFKPDIVVDIRDHWMIEWQLKSPFASYFKKIWMPTVDGHPQKPNWLEDYKKADKILGYSKYAKEVLEGESNGLIKVEAIASPGVDEINLVPMDKAEARKALGIDPNALIIGTVMRNQGRKLFPELILSYKKLLKKWRTIAKNTNPPLLYLHTSIPDIGFDIPLEIERNNLRPFVLISYVCHNCKNCFAAHWSGPKINCPFCKANEARTPNVGVGVTTAQLAKVFNAMDVYVQASVCEGWGMPIAEAKACGIPVLAVDWTAMSEQANAPGAMPIKVKSLFTDSGTMQRRAYFDQDDLVQKLIRVLKDWSPQKRKEFGLKGRESVLGSWQKAADAWIKALESQPILNRKETWGKPLDFIDVDNFKIDTSLSGPDQIRQMFRELLRVEPDEAAVTKFTSENLPLNKIEAGFKNRARLKNKLERLRVFGTDYADSVVNHLDPKDTFRILYVMPESAGDVLLSTAVVDSIKKKYPDASIYFATKEPYKSILKDNPDIKGILQYEDELLNYRITEGYADQEGLFDITYCPGIISQKIPHVLHNGHGDHILKQYAAMCGVKPGRVKIAMDYENGSRKMPSFPFITVHTGSSLDLKNYDYFQEVIKYIKPHIGVVQVGSPNDPSLKNVIDMRGQTTVQELAAIVGTSQLHIGVDSFPGHLAAALSTDVVALFGATFPQIYGPSQNGGRVVIIEPTNRWDCNKPCHLAQCTQVEKCINNIKPYDDVVKQIAKIRPDLVELIDE